MRRLALAPTLVCAFLSPPAAYALGVGDIELQSALNQPLDAEIPLRGVPAEQGDDVIVTLASEEAFRQVGLERPHSLTRLQFEVATRDGSPYIQVSTREPISEPFLNFLIEVDAPDGNLLREYTVLLDPPVFASQHEAEPAEPSGGAATEPDMTAESPEPDGDSLMNGEIASGPAAAEDQSSADSGDDAVAATGPAAGEESVVPDAGPVPPEAPEGAAGTAEPARAAEAEGAEREGEFGDTPVFLQVAQEEKEAERRQREQRQAAREAAQAEADPEPAETAATEATEPAPATTAEAPSRPEEYGEVAEGEALWDIAEQLRRGDTSVQQMMLALLRYNPEAFEDGNINRLKEGYVLRVPREDEVRSVSAQQAIARVREQNGLWREWRDSIRQEQATQVASAQEEQPADDDRTSAEEEEQPADQEPTVAAREDGDGRLDIVGAEEGGATSDESASATASESAVSEELKLAREELASVEAEKEELADRVAQLEDTVDKMEQLVTVRENQLAQLQEQLRELEEEAGATEGASAPAVDEEDDAAAAPGSGPAPEPDSGESGSPNGGGDDESAVTDAGRAEPADNAGDSGATDVAEDASGAQTSASDEQQEIVTTETEPPQRGWLDTIMGTLAGVGAAISGALAAVTGGGMFSVVLLGAAVLLLGALGVVAVQRRRAARIAAEEAELAAGVAAAQAGESDSALAEDGAPASSDAAVAPDTGDAAPEALLDDDLDLSGLDDDLGPAGTSGGDGEKDDTVAEADVYLAYGLHQQAEDLLRLALQETPGRQDYHEKLLETLFAAGKSDEFATVANDFRQQFGSGQAWQRIADMGRQIAPQHALFAAGVAGGGAGAASAAATAEPASDEELDIDLDLGAAEESPGADSFTEALRSEGDSGPDPASGSGDDDLAFDLSDLDEGEVSEAAPGAAAAAAPAEDADAGLEFDLSSLDLDSGETSPSESATETSAASPGADDGGGLDFDIGDLGDFGDDAASAGGGSDAPGTAPAAPAEPEGGDLGLDLDDALGLGDKGGENGASGDEFDFSEFEQADLGGVEAGQGSFTAAELETPELDADLDLGDSLEDQAGDDTPVMDFDLSGLGEGSTTGASNGSADNAAGGDMSDDGEDLATMLDLAKAYIDMGDAESASNALEEVIAGGNEEQRAEARNLLETVQ